MTQKTKWKLRDHPVWAWRDRVAWSVKTVRDPSWPILGSLKMGFYFRVRPARGPRPDLKNLITACEDALPGILYKNDKQIEWYLEPTGIEGVTEPDSEGVGLLIEW